MNNLILKNIVISLKLHGYDIFCGITMFQGYHKIICSKNKKNVKKNAQKKNTQNLKTAQTFAIDTAI